jgi:hypothetical protein
MDFKCAATYFFIIFFRDRITRLDLDHNDINEGPLNLQNFKNFS